MLLEFAPFEFRTVGVIALQCMQLHIGWHELAAALIHNHVQHPNGLAKICSNYAVLQCVREVHCNAAANNDHIVAAIVSPMQHLHH